MGMSDLFDPGHPAQFLQALLAAEIDEFQRGACPSRRARSPDFTVLPSAEELLQPITGNRLVAFLEHGNAASLKNRAVVAMRCEVSFYQVVRRVDPATLVFAGTTVHHGCPARTSKPENVF
jgi:hypothetical protein